MDTQGLKQYWQTEEQSAKINGWDFSHIEGRYCSEEDSLPWELHGVITRYLSPTDRLLDIDTGGGEFLLSLGHPYELTSATEGYPPNVALCKDRLGKLGIDFHEMTDYANMPFSDGMFDVVIDRHGGYNAGEIFRVLKPGGLFFTQQVGEDNDRGLVTRLLPDAEKRFAGHNLKTQAEIFRGAGFDILEQDEAFRPIRFFDTGALVWFSKIIEWEFTGFSVDKCFDRLIDTEREIRENGFVGADIHRFYFVAKKH